MQAGRNCWNVVETSRDSFKRIGRTDKVAETSRSEKELRKNVLEPIRSVSQTL